MGAGVLRDALCTGVSILGLLLVEDVQAAVRTTRSKAILLSIA